MKTAKMTKFTLVATLGLAVAFIFTLAACSYDPDKDGDGSFKMNGRESNYGNYEYKFANNSSYNVTVTVYGNTKKENKTKTLKAHSSYYETITLRLSSTTVIYSPQDKVKPEGGVSPVYFKNR